jgi:hypothetical protein
MLLAPERADETGYAQRTAEQNMNQLLADRQSESAVQCVVWGRVVDYPHLLKRFMASHPLDAQKQLDDEFVQFYEKARDITGISPATFKHDNGSGFVIVGTAEEVDRLSRTLLELLIETNTRLKNRREHRRLAIGATKLRTPASGVGIPQAMQMQAYKEASELAASAAAFEIRITGAVYESLPSSCKGSISRLKCAGLTRRNPGGVFAPLRTRRNNA